MASPKKVHLISLGCARNRVDSEVMLAKVLGGGYVYVPESKEADAIIVNTCGFIQSAKEESIDTILECAELKKSKPDLKLVVSGCLTQRYKTQLAKGLPEVDLFVGTDEFPNVLKLLDQLEQQEIKKGSVFAKRSHYLYNDKLERVNTLAGYSAYVKVAEGCQHNCSFCIIPAIRGRLRSRSVESVVAEARNLAAQGVREINLIAQDLAAYGLEPGWKSMHHLAEAAHPLLILLQNLCEVEDLQWIRLLYIYPENISDAFLEFFASQKKIVKYLDIPVQHAADSILKAMSREVTRQDLEAIFSKLRERVPAISLRTSVMVGFPGETEEDFNELLDFVAKMKFDHLGCFTYSQEEGTVAGRMANQVPQEIKELRQKKVMELQRKISKAKLKSYLGQEIDALVLGPSKESELLWEARASFQAPEVDGVVYLNDGFFKPGQVQRVQVSESHDYDLVAGVVNAEG